MPFLPSLFLIVESRTLNLIEASEACSSLDAVLDSGLFQTENKIILLTPLADYLACFKQKLT